MVDKQTDNELRLDSLRADMRNKEQELAMMTEAAQKQEELLVFANRQKEIKDRMHSITQEQFEMISPAWKFQTDEEYNTLRRELSDLEYQAQSLELAGNIARGEQALANYKSQHESLTAGLEDLKTKIAELEGE